MNPLSALRYSCSAFCLIAATAASAAPAQIERYSATEPEDNEIALERGDPSADLSDFVELESPDFGGLDFELRHPVSPRVNRKPGILHEPSDKPVPRAALDALLGDEENL